MYVIRTGPPYYNLLIKKLEQDLPKQQVITVMDNYDEAKEKMTYVPIFAPYYLVSMYYKRGREFWKFVYWCAEQEHIKLVILCNKKDDYTTVLSLCEQHNISTIQYDSYLASKRDKNRYITHMIYQLNPKAHLTQSALDLIRQRLSGYASEVNAYITKVAFSNFSRKEIMKLIPSKSKLTSSNFGFSVYHGAKLETLDRFIEKFRYYPKPLITSLTSYTDKITELYKLHLAGEFTGINYKKFVLEQGDKLGIRSEYAAKSYLDVIEHMSYSKLLLINSILSETGENRLKNIVILYKLVRIIGE